MHYTLNESSTPTHDECLVIGFLSEETTIESIMPWDPKTLDLFTRLRGKLQKSGDCIWQNEVHGQAWLLVHCGHQAEYTPEKAHDRLQDIIHALNKHYIRSACLRMPALENKSIDWQLEHMVIDIELHHQPMPNFKTQKEPRSLLEKINFLCKQAAPEAIERGKAIADGIRLTKTLANLPANHCTPTHLATIATTMAHEDANINTKIFERPDLQKMGMNAFLAVAQGSSEPPKLIEISYHGPKYKNKAPIVLIGKGVTFDSGGISIKPADGMNEMKYDMIGAASVLGTIKAIAALQLPIHIIGLIPTTENMPDGGAVKPGDIVTSMSGQTIEITNTDAEGRLILADALTYAERFNPLWVMDIATLTGAVIIALGDVASGLMSPDDALTQRIQDAAKTSEDKVWRLPLDEAYQKSLDGPMADMINANFDRKAGSVVGGCFLWRFAKKFRWAHLDIAGTAWVSGKMNHATGRPVPLLVQLLRDEASNAH